MGRNQRSRTCPVLFALRPPAEGAVGEDPSKAGQEDAGARGAMKEPGRGSTCRTLCAVWAPRSKRLRRNRSLLDVDGLAAVDQERGVVGDVKQRPACRDALGAAARTRDSAGNDDPMNSVFTNRSPKSITSPSLRPVVASRSASGPRRRGDDQVKSRLQLVRQRQDLSPARPARRRAENRESAPFSCGPGQDRC